jgi:hypothetical protein
VVGLAAGSAPEVEAAFAAGITALEAQLAALHISITTGENSSPPA